MPPDEDLDLDQPSEETEENEAWDEFEEADGGDAPDNDSPDDSGDHAGEDDQGEDTPPEEDAPADKAGAEEDPDLWQGATPAQIAAHKAAQEHMKKLEQSDRSNRGRLSALQRQLNELNARAANKPAANQGQEADEEWKQLESEYPEIAKPISSAVQAMKAKIAEQDKALQHIHHDRYVAGLAEQESLLAKEHEDWQDVTAEPGFAEWIYSQPRHIQEAAQRNAQEIVDAAEAIDLVGRYKQLRSQSSGTRTTQDDSRDTSGTETNRPLNSRRQRQIDSARGAKSRSAAVTSGIPEDGDPEKLWDQFEKMERRQR